MLVVFVEELSMKATLGGLLRKLDIDPHNVLILEHQGKSDLEQSWRRKLPAWNIPDTKFLILHDADGKDCVELKRELLGVAENCNKLAVTKVRIVCQELEAWFLGDRDALIEAGYRLPQQNPSELRAPDSSLKPSIALERWKPGRQKVSGAKEIVQYMVPERNTSESFRHTVDALRQMTGQD